MGNSANHACMAQPQSKPMASAAGQVSGFSLVEVVVAIGILAMGALALFAMIGALSGSRDGLSAGRDLVAVIADIEWGLRNAGGDILKQQLGDEGELRGVQLAMHTPENRVQREFLLGNQMEALAGFFEQAEGSPGPTSAILSMEWVLVRARDGEVSRTGLPLLVSVWRMPTTRLRALTPAKDFLPEVWEALSGEVPTWEFPVYVYDFEGMR